MTNHEAETVIAWLKKIRENERRYIPPDIYVGSRKEAKLIEESLYRHYKHHYVNQPNQTNQPNPN